MVLPSEPRNNINIQGGMSRSTFAALTITITAIIFRDFMNPDPASQTGYYKPDGGKVQTRLILGPTIRFQYCSSCGYHSKFIKFSEMLETKYPDVQIIGEHFPNHQIISIIAQTFGISKFIFIFIVFGGMDVNPYINQLCGEKGRRVWGWITTNRIYASLMVFFLCNLAQSHLSANGAFEVYFNEVRIWSKLDTGRVPTFDELNTQVDEMVLLDNNENPEELLS